MNGINTRFKKGELHPNWKGDKAGYLAIHHWLRVNFGKADHCENKDCLKLSYAFDWAKIKDLPYLRRRENFMQLCKQCHTIYDYTDEWRYKIGKSSLGRTHTVNKEGKLKMSLAGKINIKKRLRDSKGKVI